MGQSAVLCDSLILATSPLLLTVSASGRQDDRVQVLTAQSPERTRRLPTAANQPTSEGLTGRAQRLSVCLWVTGRERGNRSNWLAGTVTQAAAGAGRAKGQQRGAKEAAGLVALPSHRRGGPFASCPCWRGARRSVARWALTFHDRSACTRRTRTTLCAAVFTAAMSTQDLRNRRRPAEEPGQEPQPLPTPSTKKTGPRVFTRVLHLVLGVAAVSLSVAFVVDHPVWSQVTCNVGLGEEDFTPEEVRFPFDIEKLSKSFGHGPQARLQVGSGCVLWLPPCLDLRRGPSV